MKQYTYTHEQIGTLVTALESIQVRGLQQAQALVMCQQVIDAPVKVENVEDKIEDGEKDEPKNN